MRGRTNATHSPWEGGLCVSKGRKRAAKLGATWRRRQARAARRDAQALSGRRLRLTSRPAVIASGSPDERYAFALRSNPDEGTYSSVWIASSLRSLAMTPAGFDPTRPFAAIARPQG